MLYFSFLMFFVALLFSYEVVCSSESCAVIFLMIFSRLRDLRKLRVLNPVNIVQLLELVLITLHLSLHRLAYWRFSCRDHLSTFQRSCCLFLLRTYQVLAFLIHAHLYVSLAVYSLDQLSV